MHGSCQLNGFLSYSRRIVNVFARRPKPGSYVIASEPDLRIVGSPQISMLYGVLISGLVPFAQLSGLEVRCSAPIVERKALDMPI